MGSENTKPIGNDSLDESDIVTKSAVQFVGADSASIDNQHIKDWNEYRRMLNIFDIDIPESLEKVKHKNEELYDIILEINKKDINVTRIRDRNSFIEYNQDIYSKHKSFIDKHLPSVSIVENELFESNAKKKRILPSNSCSEYLNEQNYQKTHNSCECVIQ